MNLLFTKYNLVVQYCMIPNFANLPEKKKKIIQVVGIATTQIFFFVVELCFSSDKQLNLKKKMIGQLSEEMTYYRKSIGLSLLIFPQVDHPF